MVFFGVELGLLGQALKFGVWGCGERRGRLPGCI